MFVKTYRGKSPEDCFKKMRQEMGRDAVILQSRAYHPYLGRFGRKVHEVVAASDVSIAVDKIAASRNAAEAREEPSRSVYGYAVAGARTESSAPAKRGVNERPDSMESRSSVKSRSVDQGDGPLGMAIAANRPIGRATLSAGDTDPRLHDLERQIAALNETLEALQNAPANPKPAGGAHAQQAAGSYVFLLQRLLDAEVAEPLARRLISALPAGLSDEAAATELRAAITKRWVIAGSLQPIPGRTRVIAFIGGTGVGKTTTIAKIAAHLSLANRMRVAIITMDTHRVAAVQQLQTYGDILRVPVKVAYNRGEFAMHLEAFKKEKRDFVLLDTAGRSPHDTLPLAEVASALDGVEDLYRILTIPATLSMRDFENMVTRFQSVLAPDAMIMTKVDEATDNSFLGHLFSVQVKAGLPLAYLTSGQRVPDDMLTPDAHALATRLLSTSII